MKKFLTITATLFSAITATTSVTLAQNQAQIVHYENADGISTKMPDFKKAVVAINFGGTVGEETKVLFMKKGVRDFSEGKNPCNIPQSVVCVNLVVRNSGQASGYGGSYGSGSGFGFSTQNSFSGQMYNVEVDVEFIQRDGSNSRTIPLGAAATLTGAGTTNEWTSSSGRNSSGSFQMGGTSSVGMVVGSAASKDVNRLLNSGFKNHIATIGAMARWYPDAAETLRVALK
jgi:hypothetical protein